MFKTKSCKEGFLDFDEGFRSAINSAEVQNLVIALKAYPCLTTIKAIEDFEELQNSMKEPIFEDEQIPGETHKWVPFKTRSRRL